MNPPGMSLFAEPPLWKYGEDTWTLTDKVESYSHLIEAVGGYWSAQFTIKANRHMTDDWLQDGLGRHVAVFDDVLINVWEGFVNQITVNLGPLTVTRGPLMDAANRVRVVYSGIRYDDVDGIVIGTRLVTDDEDDADSQEEWGILPRVLSAGGMTDDDAVNVRDSYLEEHRLPATSKQWSTSLATEISITVECLGYVHWLNYPYESISTGTVNAATKIANVLAATPNSSWLSFDTTDVDHDGEQALTVVAAEAHDNIAWNVIKDVVVRGDPSYNRWLFGVYAGRRARYEPAPTETDYQQRLSQSGSRIEYVHGAEVMPWRVRPGQWIFFPDFLIGQAADLNLREDPRAMFIERTRFSAPWTLELTGGTVDTVDALVAQLGLAGIGA